MAGHKALETDSSSEVESIQMDSSVVARNPVHQGKSLVGTDYFPAEVKLEVLVVVFVLILNGTLEAVSVDLADIQTKERQVVLMDVRSPLSTS